VPGGLLSLLGIIGTIWLAIAPPVIFGHELGIIFSVFFSMLALLGYQLGTVGLCARTYSLTEKFEQNDRFLEVFYRHFQLEKGILLGLAMALVGLGVDIYILYRWIVGNFGPLYLDKVAVAALTLVVAGVQTIFFSFFISAMSLKKRIIPPLKPGGEQN